MPQLPIRNFKLYPDGPEGLIAYVKSALTGTRTI